MSQDQSAQKLVPAVERAAGILDIIATARRFLTVSELAREADLPKSTVHSLCMTLVQLGLLIRRPDQTYILGPHLLRWSNAFDRQTDIATEFAALWDQTEVVPDATFTLSVPEKAEVVFIAARQASASNRFPARPGMRLPAVFSAAGMAILSNWSDFEIRKTYIDGLPKPMTEKSARSLDQLLEEIRDVRRLGYSIEAGQCFDGVTSLGAAVLDSLNRPMAAVMLSLPSENLDGNVRPAFAQMVKSIADGLSRRMGADLPVRD